MCTQEPSQTLSIFFCTDCVFQKVGSDFERVPVVDAAAALAPSCTLYTLLAASHSSLSPHLRTPQQARRALLPGVSLGAAQRDASLPRCDVRLAQAAVQLLVEGPARLPCLPQFAILPQLLRRQLRLPLLPLLLLRRQHHLRRPSKILMKLLRHLINKTLSIVRT